MNLSETAIDRPVTVLVIAALISVVAAVMVPQIAVEMFPSVSPPFVMVQTRYPGAGPEEVEERVTKTIEQRLSSLTGLESLSSTSGDGVSRVRLEFAYSRDLDDAADDVRAALEGVGDALPDEAGDPSIMRFDPSGGSIMQLIMEGEEEAETLKRIAEDSVQPELERIYGVASADVTGGTTRTVEVALSANRLEAYGITASTVATALSQYTVRQSAGELTTGGTDYALRVNTRFSDLESVRRVVVARNGGGATRSDVVRLEDIADVSTATDDGTRAVYVDGRPAIQIAIRNESDTNTVRIAEEVREALPGINAELPDGVTVSILYDDTTYISSVLSQVYRAALQGIGLAMLILFLFLRNLRSTIIIGTSIPLSLLVTLMLMYFFDLTLNMISLTGLILGIGMIVDSSIVILENIYQYRERGAKLRTAAVLGTREMLTPIVASTLTTLSVFVPLIIWRNDLSMIGQIFGDLVFTVVIALSVSLVVAVTIVPALSAHVVKLYAPAQRPIRIRFLRVLSDAGEAVLRAVENAYTVVLRFVLQNRALVLSAVVTLFALSAVTYQSMGLNLMPRGESDDSVRIEVTMPEGTTDAVTRDTVFGLREEVAARVSGYEHLVVTTSGNSGTIQMVLPQPDRQTQSPAEIQELLRPPVRSVPDAEISFSAGRGFGGGSPVDVVIQSDDLERAYASAATIRTLLAAEVPDLTDIQTDLDDGIPEYRIVVQEDRAALFGLTSAGIAGQLAALVSGSAPATVWLDGTEIDIDVHLREADRDRLSDLSSLSVVSGTGTRIPLSNVANWEAQTGPRDVSREDQVRTVHVTADLADGAVASAATAEIQTLLDSTYVAPEGVVVSMGGDSRDISDLMGPLTTVLIVALVMVFGVMAAQFESLTDPFIIFFSIPLLLIGVVWTYRLTGASLSVFSLIGMVVLTGIVVNNGIVMVDYINLLRKRGVALYDAVVRGATRRLRPVLMTSLTTILGMVPLGFFPGAGTEMIQPIGQTIVGGLSASTAITLVVTPIVYTLVNREHRGVGDRSAVVTVDGSEREVAG